MRLTVLLVAFSACAVAQTGISERLELKGLRATETEYKGRPAVRLVEAEGAVGNGQLAIVKGLPFQDGTIEVWLAGEPGARASQDARGFVGVAFRVRPAADKYECLYLRPTNGRANDQVRRNHSVQYASRPDYDWQRLRKEFPEKYESYVDLVPGAWTQVKITVKGRQAQLFVHGAAQPCLVVNDLFLGEEGGGVALWVGPGTLAHFADFRTTP